MNVLAILTSDPHLSLKPPRCRAGETNWLEKQAEGLRELREAAKKHNCPVLCAGDIFDRWDSPAELINFALKELPDKMICVAGNHDTPYHDPKELHRSAYWTLVESGKIIDLCAENTYIAKGCKLAITGFPWGAELKPNNRHEAGVVQVALIHKYIWTKKSNSYPGVSEDSKLNKVANDIKGYDLSLFGDNHTAFLVYYDDGGIVYNHGNGFIRTIDEHSPQYGLLIRSNDGSLMVKRKPLQSESTANIITDIRGSEAEIEHDLEAIRDFVEKLRHTTESKFDFRLALKRYLHEQRPSRPVAAILRKAIREG